jgi:hypothetical protein
MRWHPKFVKTQEGFGARAEPDKPMYHLWVNKQTTNAFWNNSNLKFYETCNVMRYRTGTILNQKHAYRYGFFLNANCSICSDSALYVLSGCQHTKMRNMIIKRHNTAIVLFVQALQKGPCGANQIAYTDVGSQDKLSEQGLDLRNTANKTLPSWLLPKLTAQALEASSRPNAILFLYSTVCSSRVTTRNPNFQQLVKDKKLNPNQWEIRLIEFKSREDNRPDPQLQNAKAQHSMLIANLNRQGYREVKFHVNLVGAMGTIYKEYTDKPLADLNLDYHKIINSHRLNEHSIRHASALTKTRYALQ